MRQWIKQPEGKNVCGQIAVAVIAGITLEEAIKLTGKKGCTKTKDLVKALRKLGFECPDRCKRMEKDRLYKDLAIAKLFLPTRKSGWHWIVIENYKIFDGINGNTNGSVMWPDGWKVTSYLPVKQRFMDT